MSYLSRREILSAFLGLPVAMAACRSGAVAPLPPGEIIGASDGLGHRLRDGLKIDVPPDNWEQTSVVIVGGGVAGLSAAWRLLKKGFDNFILIELEPAPGGTSRSGTSPLISYPWGAHYLPVPTKENLDLVDLIDEMGMIEGRDKNGEPIVAEQFLCRDPEERVFYKGRWYEGLYLHAGATAEDERQLDAFNTEVSRWVSWRDSNDRRAFAIPVAAGSDDAEVTALDRISMAEWMRQHGFNSSRLTWLVDYACRDDYGMTIDQASAWAGLFYFSSRVPKPGDESQPLMTWPEGNGHMISHLFEKSKSRVRLGSAVAEIVPVYLNGKNTIEVVAIDNNNKVSGIHADRVIFASPQFLTRFIIRDYRTNPPAHVAEFQYGAWMVGNLFLKDRPQGRGFPLAWDNVLYESPALGYVAATHQRGIDRGPTVFTYYYPLCDPDPRAARTRLLATDRNGWADIALTDLQRAHPEIRSLTERLDVMRWGHAMIRPRPGFIWGGAREKAQQPYRGIHFANTDLSGVPLFEEAFYHGLRAADEVLEERGRGPGARSQ